MLLARRGSSGGDRIRGLRGRDALSGGGRRDCVDGGGSGDRVTWRNLLALGISGGLLPCPSALLAQIPNPRPQPSLYVTHAASIRGGYR